MSLTISVLIGFFAFMVTASTLPKTPPVPSRLNITTIGAANGQSTLECWQLSAPFVQSSQAGTSGAVTAQLSEAGPMSYTLIPPQFDGGLHNAPAVQCVFFSYLSLPSLRLVVFLPLPVPTLVRFLKQSTADS